MEPQDEAAFAAYVAARRDAVRRHAFLLCRDWHKADDLTQTVLVKLYQSWTTIRDPGAIDAFVRSCMVRAVIDDTRRPWRREYSTDDVPDHAPTSAPPAAGGAAADDPAAVVDREVLRHALHQVPLGQRTVLVLRFYEGLDVAATADALGCSEGNVKSQTARGLQALKQALGPDGLAAFGAGLRAASGEGTGS